MMRRMIRAKVDHQCMACGKLIRTGNWYSIRCHREHGEWYFSELCAACAEKEGVVGGKGYSR